MESYGPAITNLAAHRADVTRLTEDDLWLWGQGRHFQIYRMLGAHPMRMGGARGTHFAVWAPNAERVMVIGDFNDWDREQTPLRMRDGSGIWEGFIPGVDEGARYQFHIVSRYNGYRVDKADPVAFFYDPSPSKVSIVRSLHHQWNDHDWMNNRRFKNGFHAPMAIYEMHLGSWRRVPEQGNRPLTYLELAEQLPAYLKQMGYTHVEFLPVMEHPFSGSWGYQSTGYFAPTSRFGAPQDFMTLIDRLHQAGIGVILDWVPSHFPSDEHALGYFDGTHLYEHADKRKGFHPDWNSLIFNYGRNEVRSFLISSALFWLELYHIDGLRVDAVASMLYLDYSRKAGEWIPNEHGGRENLEAISFLRQLNEEVYRRFPDVQTIAEESTAWPMVSRPTYLGGLGFGMKWDMGWMHDSLKYFHHDPVHRNFHHNLLTFRSLYAFSENYVLSISHDEVVHGKGSLRGKMPGDLWQQFANQRLLFAWMYAQPGKKLTFMGGELGQLREWNHDSSLDWHELGSHFPQGLSKWVQAVNGLYANEKALHEQDFDPHTFEWVDCNDTQNSIVSFLRRSSDGQTILIVFNFTPVPHHDYRIGVPHGGYWRELLNSDTGDFGGGNVTNGGGRQADPWSFHGRPFSIPLTLPPLGAVFLKA
jgi:1,4-alpha-glucan branching enzyme